MRDERAGAGSLGEPQQHGTRGEGRESTTTFERTACVGSIEAGGARHLLVQPMTRVSRQQIERNPAADVIAGHPIALQLRNLQVLAEIAIERNSTIIFPAQFLDSMRAVAQFIESEGVPQQVAPSE